MGIPIYFGTKLYGWHDNGDGTSTATRFFHIYYVPVFPIASFRVLAHDPSTGTSQVQARPMHWGSMLGTYYKVWGFLAAIGLTISAADQLDSAHFLRGGVTALLALGLMLSVVAAWFWVGRQPGTPSTTARQVALPILFILPVLVMGWTFYGSARQGLRDKTREGLFGLVSPKDAAGFVKTMAKQDLAKKQAKCDQGNATACSDLAYDLEHGGLGVERDPARAAELYQKSCDGGSSTSCFTAGMRFDEKDPPRALKAFAKGCELGSAASCTNAGVAYLNGAGVEKDVARAVGLYEKACEKGEPTSCSNLGGLYSSGKSVKKDKARAKSYYQKGCALKDTKACTLARKR